MFLRVVLTWLLMTSSAWASCVTLDTSTWTQEQKNARIAVAYDLAFTSGVNEVPTVTGNDICFPILDPTALITESAMLTRHADLEAIRQAKAMAEANRIAALRTEQTTLETDVDAGLTGWVGLTPTEKTEVLRKSMRLNRVERALGR